jgi:ribosome-associated protein
MPARGDEPLRIPTGRSSADVLIPAREIVIEYARSGGPGGQRVNKVETKAVLRFDLGASRAFDETQRERLLRRLASRLTTAGEIVLHASRFRDRQRNVEDARTRLAALLTEALRQPKRRRPTKPTRSSKEKRLREKRNRSETKRTRRETE